jgi:hypothetical protein
LPDILMLSGWDGTNPAGVHRVLDEGIPVVWYPAAAMPLSRVTAMLTNTPPAGDTGATRTVWEDMPAGMQLKVAAPEHPVFRAFGNGEFGDPARGRVRGRLAVPASQLPPGEPLLAYADGLPAVWLCRGTKPLVLWTMPLDKDLSTVPNQGEYVPFLGELLLEARRGSPGAVRPVREHVPGQTLIWRSGMETRTEELRLRGPDGAEMPVKRMEAAGGVWVSDRLERPGVYAWAADDRVLGRETVNFPAVESDLRPLAGAEIKGLGALAAASGRDVREWQAGIALWPRLLWMTLALLLCEGVVAAIGPGRTTRNLKPET